MLIAHDFGENIFIKTGNFLLGGVAGAVGVEPSLFPSVPTQLLQWIGTVFSG